MSHLTPHPTRHARLLVPSELVAPVALLASTLGAAAAFGQATSLPAVARGRFAATPRHATDGPVYGGTLRVAYTKEESDRTAEHSASYVLGGS